MTFGENGEFSLLPFLCPASYQAWDIHGDNILDPTLILVAALALIWIYMDVAEQN